MSAIKDKVHETIPLLCARFPKCFFHYEGRRRPLKIGIFHDLKAVLGESVSATLLRHVLSYYTHNSGYLRAQQAGAERIGLDGDPQGVVTEKEALHASSTIAERRRRGQKPKQKKPKQKKPEPRRDGLAALREAAAARRKISAGARHG